MKKLVVAYIFSWHVVRRYLPKDIQVTASAPGVVSVGQQFQLEYAIKSASIGHNDS